MSRKVLFTATTFALGMLLIGSAGATVYTWDPTPADLYDLDHDYVYQWGIADDLVFAGEHIVGAWLTIENISNWDNGANDLYIHLLNDLYPLPVGVTATRDLIGNADTLAFLGAGPLMLHWQDTNGARTTDDLTIDLVALGLLGDLIVYAADGTFGFGFDPDCHFNNDGVQFVVETDSCIPEPTTMALLACGGAAMMARRRKLR